MLLDHVSSARLLPSAILKAGLLDHGGDFDLDHEVRVYQALHFNRGAGRDWIAKITVPQIAVLV